MKTRTIIKTLVLGLSLALATNKIIAQDTKPVKEGGDYTNAFGLRGGETSGLTFKHKFYNNNAMEVILGTSPFAISLTGLYEKYISTGARGLQCYFGGGGHIANQYNYTRYYDYYRDRYYYRTYYNGPAVGIDGIMGIEYKIPKAPFAFSFDLKPNFEVAPGSPVYGSIDPGLGVKLAF